MPLFQFLCPNCEAETEMLVRGQDEPSCPKCGSAKLVKQASRFNALNGGGAPKRDATPAPCGLPSCCGGGACGLN